MTGQEDPHPPSSRCTSLQGFHLYFPASDSRFPVLPQEGPPPSLPPPPPPLPPPPRQACVLFLTHANSAGRASQLNADPVSPRLNATNEPFPSAAKCQSHQSQPSRGGGGERGSRDTAEVFFVVFFFSSKTVEIHKMDTRMKFCMTYLNIAECDGMAETPNVRDWAELSRSGRKSCLER